MEDFSARNMAVTIQNQKKRNKNAFCLYADWQSLRVYNLQHGNWRHLKSRLYEDNLGVIFYSPILDSSGKKIYIFFSCDVNVWKYDTLFHWFSFVPTSQCSSGILLGEDFTFYWNITFEMMSLKLQGKPFKKSFYSLKRALTIIP